MTTDHFWSIIEHARADATRSPKVDPAEHVQHVSYALYDLEREEALGFQLELRKRFVESHRWDLRAIAHLVHGECSDVDFIFFRAWLVLQGRTYFEGALEDPQRAADRAETGTAWQEEFWWKEFFFTAFEDPALLDEHLQKEPDGERWEESQLPKRYPELFERLTSSSNAEELPILTIIRSILPTPIREEHSRTCSVLTGSHPGLVRVRVRPASLDIDLYGVQWYGHTPVGNHTPFATAALNRLPKDHAGLTECLSHLVQAAVLIRQATFRTCQYCGKSNPPEWQDDEHTCQSCAERVLGVVY